MDAASTRSGRSTCEVGLLPRSTRLGAVYARRDAGAGDFHAGHQGRYAAAGFAVRAGPVQALHAALQFPAVQRGRSEIPARSGTARNRPRRTGGKSVAEPAAARGGFSVRDALGVGHSGIEWIVVDGYRVRRFAGVDGCRRADEGSLRGNRRWGWSLAKTTRNIRS